MLEDDIDMPRIMQKTSPLVRRQVIIAILQQLKRAPPYELYRLTDSEANLLLDKDYNALLVRNPVVPQPLRLIDSISKILLDKNSNNLLVRY